MATKAGKGGKARPEKRKECEKDAGAVSKEDYFVGQVANSLFQNKPTGSGTHPLLQLFSAPAAETQPIYLAVPKENKKRKCAEEEIATKVQSSSALNQPLKKMKKVNKKELSLAEKNLAKRECALEQADEEEEKKDTKLKQKPKNSRPVTKYPSASDDNVGRKQWKTGIHKAEEMLKNKRTVFVGNLPVSCTEQMLKSFFREYGQIESIRFRSLIPSEDTVSRKLAAIKRMLHPNRKYINAYIVFKEEHAANDALKCNGTEFCSGFHIRVDLASKSTCHDNKRSVFVGNFPYAIDDETVRSHFSQCGNVMGVRIVRDKRTGIGKGFGYVLFETTDAVHLALKLNNAELEGRKLRVKRCVEGEKTQHKSPHNKAKSPIGLKYTKATSLKNTKGSSSNTFVGEKADPLKKSKKSKTKNNMKKKLKKAK
ncbi:RNA-binding protein 34 [Anolis sagrei]|uniref:RNA-binding protein 34 n=1 Tax=Anolis sagrei TaxID=38937 RepID=UPI0035224A49